MPDEAPPVRGRPKSPAAPPPLPFELDDLGGGRQAARHGRVEHAGAQLLRVGAGRAEPGLETLGDVELGVARVEEAGEEGVAGTDRG